MRRAPLRAEICGAVLLLLGVVSVVAYWRTGLGPFAGAAFTFAVLGVMLAWPVRD